MDKHPGAEAWGTAHRNDTKTWDSKDLKSRWWLGLSFPLVPFTAAVSTANLSHQQTCLAGYDICDNYMSSHVLLAYLSLLYS